VIAIKRKASRPGGEETPFVTPQGFKLADPCFGNKKHHGKHAFFVRTLDEAAQLIAKGYSIWMSRPGKRESLICPASLEILRG
jgi:hypothetical protein